MIMYISVVVVFSDGFIIYCLARGVISFISESANVWLLLEVRVDQSSRD